MEYRKSEGLKPKLNIPRQPVDHFSCSLYCLVGLVVKASTSSAEDPGFDSRLRRWDFSGSNHTSDLKIDIPMATLPGARRYWVSAGTGRPGVSKL